MADKIWISGNFLVVEDAISRDIYFKIGVEDVLSLRNANDDFSFHFNIPSVDEKGNTNFRIPFFML